MSDSTASAGAAGAACSSWIWCWRVSRARISSLCRRPSGRPSRRCSSYPDNDLWDLVAGRSEPGPASRGRRVVGLLRDGLMCGLHKSPARTGLNCLVAVHWFSPLSAPESRHEPPGESDDQAAHGNAQLQRRHAAGRFPGALRARSGRKWSTSAACTRKTGKFTYDPGFMSTASCKSAITYIDGDKGVLLYRGYPIEQLAEKCDFLEVCYLLLKGELPTLAQKRRVGPQHHAAHHGARAARALLPRLPPRRAPDGGHGRRGRRAVGLLSRLARHQ